MCKNVLDIKQNWKKCRVKLQCHSSETGSNPYWEKFAKRSKERRRKMASCCTYALATQKKIPLKKTFYFLIFFLSSIYTFCLYMRFSHCSTVLIAYIGQSIWHQPKISFYGIHPNAVNLCKNWMWQPGLSCQQLEAEAFFDEKSRGLRKYLSEIAKKSICLKSTCNKCTYDSETI